MKERYKYFLGYNENEKKKFVEESVIVLDTNVLLNLYRYSIKSREKLFEILNKVKDRVYLTDQICLEFFKNRPNEIISRSNSSKSIEKKLDDLINELKDPNHNFESLRFEEELLKSFISKLSKLKETLKSDTIKACDITIDFLNTDPILNKLMDLIANKVFDQFSDEELEKIHSEGKLRFKTKIPPGYKDSNKGEPDCYNDLVIFKEMIKLSTEYSKDILFITSDEKEDWWQIVKGKKLGPRPSLLKEFTSETNQNYFMYTTENFIRFASELFDIKETEVLIAESANIEEHQSKSVIKVPVLYSQKFKPNNGYVRVLAQSDSMYKNLNIYDSVTPNFLDSEQEFKLGGPICTCGIKLNKYIPKVQFERCSYYKCPSCGKEYISSN